MRRLMRLLLGTVLVLTACGDNTSMEEGTPEAELQFMRFPPDLRPLVTTQASFWAVKGRNVEFVMRYLPEEPGGEGEEFLEFRLDGQSLLRRPDGTRFQTGDSIRIEVRVSPDGRFLFDFEPSGLVFDPNRPARLKVKFRRNEGDLDGDGDSDEDDDDLDRRIRMWKQERAGAPWFPVGTIRLQEDEIEGRISSFTGFAIAG